MQLLGLSSQQDVGFQEQTYREGQAEAVLPFLTEPQMVSLLLKLKTLLEARGCTAPISQWEESQSPLTGRALGWEISLWPALEISLPSWMPRIWGLTKFSRWRMRWDHVLTDNVHKESSMFSVVYSGSISWQYISTLTYHLKVEISQCFRLKFLSHFKLIIIKSLKHTKAKKTV